MWPFLILLWKIWEGRVGEGQGTDKEKVAMHGSISPASKQYYHVECEEEDFSLSSTEFLTIQCPLSYNTKIPPLEKYLLPIFTDVHKEINRNFTPKQLIIMRTTATANAQRMECYVTIKIMQKIIPEYAKLFM